MMWTDKHTIILLADMWFSYIQFQETRPAVGLLSCGPAVGLLSCGPAVGPQLAYSLTAHRVKLLNKL